MTIDWSKVQIGKTVLISGASKKEFHVVALYGGEAWLVTEDKTFGGIYNQQRLNAEGWTIREEWEECTEEFELYQDMEDGTVKVVYKANCTILKESDCNEGGPFKLDGLTIWRKRG